TFRRPHGHLWKLARQRYFEASVTRATSPFTFGAGWYDQESSGPGVWRWMKRPSVTRITAPCRELAIDIFVPDPKTTITITLDARIIDRVPGTSAFPRTYRVNAPRQ